MITPNKSVLLFGDINVDNILKLPEFPVPGRDAYAEHVEMHLGGAVTNSAAVMQSLGLPAKLLGAVGDDTWSKFVFDELHKAHVDTKHVVIKPDVQTGLIFIAVTPNGERTMFSYRGANITIQPKDLSQDLLEDIALVELSGYVFLKAPQKDTAWQLIEMASDQGIPISMDTGLDPVILADETIRAVLPKLSVLITGFDEAKQLTLLEDHQQQIAALLAFGVKQVAIKLGPHGAWLGWQGGKHFCPAFPVKAVDTTGAGDAFSAGLIYGFLDGFNPVPSLILANALGGLATTVYGAARFERKQVVAFLEEMRDVYDLADQDHDAYTEVLHRLRITNDLSPSL